MRDRPAVCFACEGCSAPIIVMGYIGIMEKKKETTILICIYRYFSRNIRSALYFQRYTYRTYSTGSWRREVIDYGF